MVQIYSAHKPRKVRDVGALLDEWKDDEDELLSAIEHKYLDPASLGPVWQAAALHGAPPQLRGRGQLTQARLRLAWGSACSSFALPASVGRRVADLLLK